MMNIQSFKNGLNYRSSVWRRHGLTFGVWGLAVAGAFFLVGKRTHHFEIVGAAQNRSYQIASKEIARIQTILVRPYEKIRQGQTVALLEDECIRCELSVATAEAARLKAELNALRDKMAVEAQEQTNLQLSNLRRFATDIEDARILVLNLTTSIETDRLTLQDLQLKMEVKQKLYSSNAATIYERETARITHDALNKKIRENEAALKQAKMDLKEAQDRHNAFFANPTTEPSIDLALAPLHEAITVQERKIDGLALNRALLVLKSPIEGTVDFVYRNSGETIRPAEPILTIIPACPSEIVGYLLEDRPTEIMEGDAVEVFDLRNPSQPTAARILKVAPAIEEIPIHLRRNPNIPEWGQPVLVSIPPELKLLSGERVKIVSK
jgi:multidrug resistance efflux pump